MAAISFSHIGLFTAAILLTAPLPVPLLGPVLALPFLLGRYRAT
jgi:hypothetical protein